MRSHPTKCFENEQMQPFPQEVDGSFNIESYDEVMTTISVVCHCRLPESYDNMICCDLCNEWYHYQCDDVSSTHVQESEWFCQLCRRPSKVARIE